jgi:predicted SAM-dependent methyltransferase
MKLTLNVGCGTRVFDEYPKGYKCINMDGRHLPKVHVIGDVRKIPYQDEYFDYILASDIIEHFPLSQTKQVLAEWRRVLKRGGILEMRTPNMEWMAKEYMKKKDCKWVSYHIFGGQDYSGNFHYVIFDGRWLEELCATIRLQKIEYEEKGSNFIMKVRKL